MTSMKKAHERSLISACVMAGVQLIALILMSTVSVYAGLFIIPTIVVHLIYLWKLRHFTEVHKKHHSFIANVTTLVVGSAETVFLIFAAAFPGYPAYVLFIFCIFFYLGIAGVWIWRYVVYAIFIDNRKHHAQTAGTTTTTTTVVIDQNGHIQNAAPQEQQQQQQQQQYDAAPPSAHYAPPPSETYAQPSQEYSAAAEPVHEPPPPQQQQQQQQQQQPTEYPPMPNQEPIDVERGTTAAI